jgi:hypothetical protein
MIQVQFGADVVDAYDNPFNGFVDPAKKWELRTLASDVPTFQFEDADSASRFIYGELGRTEVLDGPEEDGTQRRYAVVVDFPEYDEDEEWHRFAVIKQVL